MDAVSYTFSANAASYNGLEIVFDFGNNFGANTKTVQITECDIRVTNGIPSGQQAPSNFIPSPELRPIGIELPFCQRYFFSTFGNGVTPANASSTFFRSMGAATSSGSIALGSINFPVEMFSASPMITVYSPNVGTPTNGEWSSYVGGSWGAGALSTTQLNATQVSFNLAATVTAGDAYMTAGNFTASAEL